MTTDLFLLKNVQEVLEFIVHDHISYFSNISIVTVNMLSVNLVPLRPAWLNTLTPFAPSYYARSYWFIYFDLCDAFDVVFYSLPLFKISNFGLSPGCVNWFYSDFTSIDASVLILAPFLLMLWSLIFCLYLLTIFMHPCIIQNISCWRIILRYIMNMEGCKLLQYDVDTVQCWCFDSGMILNSGKTTAISFTRKTKNN
jgi:hypothetical protein